MDVGLKTTYSLSFWYTKPNENLPDGLLLSELNS